MSRRKFYTVFRVMYQMPGATRSAFFYTRDAAELFAAGRVFNGQPASAQRETVRRAEAVRLAGKPPKGLPQSVC